MMTQKHGPVTKFADTRNGTPSKFKDTKLVFIYYANLTTNKAITKALNINIYQILKLAFSGLHYTIIPPQ